MSDTAQPQGDKDPSTTAEKDAKNDDDSQQQQEQTAALTAGTDKNSKTAKRPLEPQPNENNKNSNNGEDSSSKRLKVLSESGASIVAAFGLITKQKAYREQWISADDYAHILAFELKLPKKSPPLLSTDRLVSTLELAWGSDDPPDAENTTGNFRRSVAQGNAGVVTYYYFITEPGSRPPSPDDNWKEHRVTPVLAEEERRCVAEPNYAGVRDELLRALEEQQEQSQKEQQSAAAAKPPVALQHQHLAATGGGGLMAPHGHPHAAGMPPAAFYYRQPPPFPGAPNPIPGSVLGRGPGPGPVFASGPPPMMSPPPPPGAPGYQGVSYPLPESQRIRHWRPLASTTDTKSKSPASIRSRANILEQILKDMTKGDQVYAGDILLHLLWRSSDAPGRRRTPAEVAAAAEAAKNPSTATPPTPPCHVGRYVRGCLAQEEKPASKLEASIADNLKAFLAHHAVSGNRPEVEQNAVDAVLVAACFQKRDGCTQNALARRLGLGSNQDKIKRCFDWAQKMRDSSGGPKNSVLKFVPAKRKPRSDSNRDEAVARIEEHVRSDGYEKNGTVDQRYERFVQSVHYQRFQQNTNNGTICRSMYRAHEKDIQSKRLFKKKRTKKGGATATAAATEEANAPPPPQQQQPPPPPAAPRGSIRSCSNSSSNNNRWKIT